MYSSTIYIKPAPTVNLLQAMERINNSFAVTFVL